MAAFYQWKLHPILLISSAAQKDEAAYRGFMPPAVSFDHVAATPPVSSQLSWAGVRRGTEAGQDLFSWQWLSPLLPSLRQKHRENRI